MRLQTYRGYRIRASDKSLVFRFSAGLLLLLFLAVVMLLNLKSIITTDWKAISLFEDGSVYLPITPYRIVTIIVATLVCVLSALFYRRFQYDRVKQLFHRQKLARMILENGWYESGLASVRQERENQLLSKTVLPYGTWSIVYPYRNYIREISRPTFTLGKEAGNRIVL